MTTEQMALVKKLIQKHEIEATDAEWTLIFLGVGYGLSEQQIDSYLVMNTTDLLVKHEKMLCLLLGWIQECREKPMKFKIRQNDYKLNWSNILDAESPCTVMKV